MSLTGNNVLTGSGHRTNQPPFEIDQSLRFEDGDTPKLTRTPGSAGSLKTWTISAWVKRGNLSDGVVISAGNYAEVKFSSDTLYIGVGPTNSTQFAIQTSAVYRDPSAWYHIVVAADTTQASASNRLKLYVNGEEVTAFAVDQRSSISQDVALTFTGAYEHRIGVDESSAYFDGYIAEVNFIDGQALTPASFGETLASTNQWVPIEYTGSYGTNGFYLPFSSTELANSFTDSSRTFIPTENITADFLVIGGGGGGGNGDRSGGGGAGGYRTSAGTSGGGASAESSLSLTSGSSYAVTVGAGGAASTNGSDSSIIGPSIDVTSLGGGAGAQSGGSAPSSGGSGGGGGAGSTGSGAGASGTSGQGYAGGDGASSSGGNNVSGGGGGGAGAVGVNVASDDANGGAGGAGVSSSITGSAVTRAGGGGGGAWTNTGGSGGSGGGGAGGRSGVAGTVGTANTGGGGGGGGTAPGAGGLGIVIIRYAGSSPKASGGTITSYTDGGTTYQVHTFTSSAHTITANGDVTNTRAQKKVGSSSIYFDGTADYLSVADSADWALGSNFTVETWVRFASTSSDLTLLNHWKGNGVAAAWALQLDGGNTVKFFYSTDGTNSAANSSWSWTPSLNTWYHVAVVRDGSDLELYIDGTQTGSTYDISSSTIANIAWPLEIGYYSNIGGYGLNGYMDEIRISNSTRYTGTFTPSTTAFTADANTLLLIHSDFNGGIGADSSGNTNDFSATNLVATDQVLDSPTNNFATLNSLIKSNGTLTYSEGNLKIVAGSNWNNAVATISAQSGKWYMEFLAGSPNTLIGVIGDETERWWNGAGGNPQDTTTGQILYYGLNGNKRIDGSDTSYGNSYTDGDIIGIALNLDDSEITFYKNGTAQNSGTAISFSGNISNSSDLAFAFATYSATSYANFGQDSSFAGSKTAQGNGGDGEDFYYTPPTGYKSLATKSLDDPAIALPGDYFNTILYTGDGGTTQAETGVGFSPDFVWIKDRSTAYPHNLWDTVRGVQKLLESNSTGAESTHTDMLNVFDADGFTHGNQNAIGKSSDNYVAWNWKAAGTAVSNGNGSITSSVSANTTAGFSIVSYTGTGSTATVGHGLSVAPEFLVVKNRTTGSTSWQVGSDALTSWLYYITLSSTASQNTNTQMWNSTAPTSSVFTVKDAGDVNTNTNNYIAYCFASIEGYSKVGSYTGNGNNDGTFVYTGFRPAFVLLKSSSASNDWILQDNKRDTYNAVGHYLRPNTNDAELDEDSIDFLSNGFKLRTTSGARNTSSGTYIYLAFAESPFKTANAR